MTTVPNISNVLHKVLIETNEQLVTSAFVFEAVLDVLKKDYGVRIVNKPLCKSSRNGTFMG